MDLTTLQGEVRTRTGTPTDDSLITSAVLIQVINAALQHNSSERDWPWLEKTATIATANGDPDYAVPADWMRTVSVIGASGVPLRRTPIDELDYLNGAGTPRFFGIYGDQVVVKPVPVGTENLTHRYIGTQPALAAGGDTPLMPAGYHYAIVEYAAYLVFRRTGNLAEAGGALAAYEDWRSKMERQADRWSDSQGGALNADPALKVKAAAQ